MHEALHFHTNKDLNLVTTFCSMQHRGHSWYPLQDIGMLIYSVPRKHSTALSIADLCLPVETESKTPDTTRAVTEFGL